MKLHIFQQNTNMIRRLGFTVIELMISTTIGLVLCLGFVTVLIDSSTNNRANDRTTDIQMNGRAALEALRRDVIHAGFRALTWAEPNAVSIGAITGDCANGFSANLRQGIWGANDTNPFPATCIPAANYAGGDVLVIRRTSLAPVTALAATTVYFRSSYERGELFLGSAPPTFTEVPNEDRTLEVIVYYISPYSFSAAENPRIPGLYRITLRPGPLVGNPELVAPGVDTLQVQFGRHTTDGNTIFQNANAVSASATSITTDPSEWDDVNSVRISILVRALTAELKVVNTTSYTLGDKIILPNDNFRRLAFTITAQLRN
jgi:type II secretory pathway pseudopilin PulG